MQIKLNIRYLIVSFLILILGIVFVKSLYLKQDELTIDLISSFIFYDIKTFQDRHIAIFNLPILSVFLSFMLCNISIVLENTYEVDMKYMQLIRCTSLKVYIMRFLLKKFVTNIVHICTLFILYLIAMYINGFTFMKVIEILDIGLYFLKLLLFFNLLTIMFFFFQMYYEKDIFFSISIFLIIIFLSIYFIIPDINMICYSKNDNIYEIMLYILLYFIFVNIFIISLSKGTER